MQAVIKRLEHGFGGRRFGRDAHGGRFRRKLAHLVNVLLKLGDSVLPLFRGEEVRHGEDALSIPQCACLPLGPFFRSIGAAPDSHPLGQPRCNFRLGWLPSE